MLTAINERHQLRILFRDSLRRAIDLESLSAEGDAGKLAGQAAALLAAIGFAFLMLTGPEYLAGRLTEGEWFAAAQGETYFLFATTFAVAGLVAVFAWNTVLPDRRDCAILGVLPVRLRTLFVAKVGAVATAVGSAILALNIFPGLFYPVVVFSAAARSEASAGDWLHTGFPQH